jgi:O-antigen/teichoic acid export membrane protein
MTKQLQTSAGPMTTLAALAPASAKPGANARLSRNIFSSINAKVLYLASRFFLPPVILANITLEEYGLWSLCFILIAWLGMGAFGISNVYVRYVAQYHASGQTQQIGALLSTGVTLVSAFAVLVLVSLWWSLPAILSALDVPAAQQDQAFVLVFGCVMVFMLDLSLGAFVYVLAGLQQIVQQNRIWIASFLLETVLVVAFMLSGAGVQGLLYAFALRYALSTLLSIWMCYRHLPGLKISVRLFNREHLALFCRFGGILQLSGLLGMFLRSVERLVAGMFINVQAAGLFDVAEKMPIMATSIPSSINAACLPAATELHVQGRQREFDELYLRSARHINLITGLMMGFMAAFASPLITAWLGVNAGFAAAPFILACFTLPFQLNVLTGPASTVFRSIGKPRHELIYPLLQLLLVLLLVAAGFWLVGVNNEVIAVTVAIAMIVSALVYLVYTNRYLCISQIQFCRQVLLPGVVPYVTGFAIVGLLQSWVHSVALDRIGCALVILVAGGIYVAVQACLNWAWLLTDSEKHFARDRLRALLGRITSA